MARQSGALRRSKAMAWGATASSSPDARRPSLETFAWAKRARLEIFFDPDPRHFGHGARVREAATWRVRRVAVEELGDRAQSTVREVLRQRREQAPGMRACAGRASVRVQIGAHVGAEEPRMDRALVARAVARHPV